jgi:hypothetical protein
MIGISLRKLKLIGKIPSNINKMSCLADVEVVSSSHQNLIDVDHRHAPCTVHGTPTRRPTAAPWQHRCDDASRGHALVTHSLLLACSVAPGSSSSLSLSLYLSLSLRCCFVWFKSVLKCFRMFSFMQICGCGV